MAVPVTTAQAATRDFTSQADGIVTSSSCTAGRRIRSGKAPVQINGHPILALHLTSPPWRTLDAGSHGKDVMALQKELGRLGYAVEADGRYESSTAQAMQALWATVGVAKEASLPIAQVIWLPATSAVPNDCPVGIGDHYAAGTPLFSSGGGLVSAHAVLPVTAVQGSRVAVLETGQTTPISPDGSIQDKQFLQAFAQTRQYKAWVAAPDQEKLTVTVKLAQPLQVKAVPPSSLYDVTGTKGCLFTGSTAAAVTIVASQLGETFVTGPDLPARVMVTPPESAPRCL
jgi:peptidoglycan hydrolase-like protein with peptidoglycan-binding domain